MKWVAAPDIKERIDKVLSSGLFPQIDGKRIAALRGTGSSSRAIARIWSLSAPWRLVLAVEPRYIIEVIAERFDRQSEEEKDRTIIHELMHIPRNFTGGLVPHRGRGPRINPRTVEILYQRYKLKR